jgi:hypothetical protein
VTSTQAVCLAALATLVLGGVYFTRTGHAPPGQPKLVELKASSLSTLQSGFNRESGKLRVILLLSPTCPTCLEGASAVEDVLKRHPDSQIVVFAVWEPMLSTDWSKPGTGPLQRLSDSTLDCAALSRHAYKHPTGAIPSQWSAYFGFLHG